MPSLMPSQAYSTLLKELYLPMLSLNSSASNINVREENQATLFIKVPLGRTNSF